MGSGLSTALPADGPAADRSVASMLRVAAVAGWILTGLSAAAFAFFVLVAPWFGRLLLGDNDAVGSTIGPLAAITAAYTVAGALFSAFTARTYVAWCRRRRGALARAWIVAAILIGGGVAAFVGALLAEAVKVESGYLTYAVALGLAGLGAALVAKLLDPALAASRSARPTAGAPPGSTPAKAGFVRYQCPGCRRGFTLAREPPAGTRCPACSNHRSA